MALRFAKLVKSERDYLREAFARSAGPVLDLAKVWSDAAREASIEEREANAKGKPLPEVQLKPAAKEYTNEDGKAVRTYQWSGSGINYQDINGMMRGEHLDVGKDPKMVSMAAAADTKAREVANQLNDVLSRSTLDKDVVLYRGVHPGAPGLGNFAKNKDQLVGKELPASGFQSTTTDKNQKVMSNNPIVMEIHAPAGTHGIDISKFKGATAAQNIQHEVILGEGHYKVRSVSGKRMVVDYIEGPRRKF